MLISVTLEWKWKFSKIYMKTLSKLVIRHIWKSNLKWLLYIIAEVQWFPTKSPWSKLIVMAIKNLIYLVTLKKVNSWKLSKTYINSKFSVILKTFMFLSYHMEGKAFAPQERLRAAYSRSVPLSCRYVYKFYKRFLFQRIFQALFGWSY